IRADLVRGYRAETRTCTIVCDERNGSHPTVLNEESPRVEDDAVSTLLKKVWRWLPHVDAVLTTGSLSTGLPTDFYAEILDRARMRGKLTAIDAAGEVLRAGLLVQPAFTKPNAEEFHQLTRSTGTPGVLRLPPHTALTLGESGAVLIHEGRCLHAPPPRVFRT